MSGNTHINVPVSVTNGLDEWLSAAWTQRDCPPPFRLWSVAMGVESWSDDEREHFLSCERCQLAEKRVHETIQQQVRAEQGASASIATVAGSTDTSAESWSTSTLSSYLFPTLTALSKEPELRDLLRRVFEPVFTLEEVVSEVMERVMVRLKTAKKAFTLTTESAFGSNDELHERIQFEQQLASGIRCVVAEHRYSEQIAVAALCIANMLGDLNSARLDQAIETLEDQALAHDSLETRLLLAICYFRRGCRDDAECQLQKAFGIIHDPEARLNL